VKTLGAIELAERLLALDPLKRISAADATDLPYFTTEEPSAEQPTMFVFLLGVDSYLTFREQAARCTRRLARTGSQGELFELEHFLDLNHLFRH
jgi:hypothetical protein